MKKIVLFLLLSSLSCWVHGQIKFSSLSEVEPNDEVKFLVGDGANNARKINYATLKTFLGIGIYPTRVVSVADMNNPTNFRNKIVQTTSGLSYAVDFMGNAVLLGSFDLTPQNVVTIQTAQTITGKKIFADTASFTKGLKSSGNIETKGVSTTGTSAQSAISIQGAIAEKDTIIETDNFQMNWNHGIAIVKTLTANKVIKLPPIGTKNDWNLTLKNETLDLDGYTLFIKDSNGNAIYQVTGKIIVKFKIKNLAWEREAVSMF
jgi:hypothetical protein